MYYIYHIPGVKIGCTNNLHRRLKTEQKANEFFILETHIDIYEASNREIELQKKYGYKIDTIPYYVSIERLLKGKDKGNSKEARAKAVSNTNYVDRVKNTDYALIASKIDYKLVAEKISKSTKGRIPWNKGLTGVQKVKRNKLGQYAKD
jgi:hypothetical protein